MTTYVRYPIETNPQQLMLDAYAYIKSRSPNWNPNDANLEVWIIQFFASVAADNRDLASDVPDDIFRYLGASLLGLPPLDEAQSLVTSTWTMTDTSGHTIPAGTEVSINDSAGNPIAFETLFDTVVPAGSSATGAGAVLLRSILPGAFTAGLGAAGVAAQLQTTLEYVSTVVLAATSQGGLDAEDNDAYMNRLSRRLRLLNPRPVLPADFALLALDVAGVYRVVAIDLYNPGDNTCGHGRTITLCAVDAPTNAAIVALMAANREQNWVIHTMGANRTGIDINFVGKAATGYNAAAVQAAVIARLQAYLNPAVWGSQGSDDPQTWVDIPFVRYSEIAQVISDTDGLDYWTTLQIAKHGNALGTADLALTGPASLVFAQTITGAVT